MAYKNKVMLWGETRTDFETKMTDACRELEDAEKMRIENTKLLLRKSIDLQMQQLNAASGVCFWSFL